MKTILIALVLTFSLTTLACNQEAQFLGTVTNVKYFPETNHYSYQIKLGHGDDFWFQSSFLCPMDEEQLQNAVIQEAGSPTKNAGDKIWGVMIFDQKLQDYRVD